MLIKCSKWILLIVAVFLAAGRAVASSAVRTLPSVYHWEQPLAVSIQVIPSSDVLAWVVEEHFPPNWAVTNVNPSGNVFPGVIKFGLYFDNVSRVFTYQLIPPNGETNTITLSGQASFNGSSIQVSGQQQTALTRPRLQMMSLQGGKFQFSVTGLPGQRYLIETSSSTTNWVTAGIVTNVAGSVQFVDHTATNVACRFYRAVLQPP